MGRLMPDTETCKIGIVLERRVSDNEWLDHEWVTIGLTLNVVDADDWVQLYDTEEVCRYLSPAVELEIHRAETEAYLYNLESPEPSIFAVLRHDEESEEAVPFEVHVVTASPYEAQDYLDSSEEHVDRIALPEELRAWLQEFVDEHHIQEEFKKRRRDKVSVEEHKFGQESLVELRKRMGPDGSGSVH